MKSRSFMTRISTGALLCALLTASVSCGESGVSADTTGNDSPDSATASAPTEILPPEGNFGGSSFRILVSDSVLDDYDRPEENGEIVNDALYKRELNISERLNIVPEYITQPGEYADRNTFNAHIASSVMAGDDSYDLIIGMTVIVFPIAADGYFCDFTSLQSLSPDAPWWMRDMTENLGINGKLFGALGDASLSLYTHINVMYFNQKLIGDYKFPDPYETVRSGKWTIDTLMSQCKGLGADVNGNDKADNDDFYGFLSIRVPARSLQTSLGLDLITKNEKDIPVLLPLSQKITDAVDHMRSFFSEGRDSLWENLQEADALKMFSSGQSVYLAGYLYNTESLRDMKEDFGIIPYPKYDENDSYHTQIGTTTQAFFIPITAKDPERSAVVLENMGYESMKNVIPAYYEVTLKDKYARDEQVRGMLDLIRESAKMDFAFAYNTCFTPQFSMFLTDMLSPAAAKNPASYFEQNHTAWEAQLGKIAESYQ